MIYLFDTNILVHYIRQSAVKSFVEQTYNPADATNKAVISVVSVGEIRSLAIQNNWGLARLTALEALFSEFIIADINTEDIINAYAIIDAFSQGKLAAQPLPGSSKNMGKNDLWIAATAHVLEAALLTTDHDFNHLDGIFLKLEKVQGATNF